MKVAFRVDSNLNTGFGHFSRVINLCQTWRIIDRFVEVVFIGNYNDFAISKLKYLGLEYLYVPRDDFSELYTSLFDNYDYVLFDSYFLAQEQLQLISDLSNKTIIIDDLCNYSYHNIDYVINFRFNANHLFSYDSKFSLLGISYLIVSPELVRLRESRIKNFTRKFVNITLFFGGAFENIGIIEKVIETLYNVNPSFRISLVSGLVIENYPHVTYILPNNSIEKIFEESDLIIAGGGLIKYESAFAMIPTFSFSTNELQDEDNRLLAKENILVDLGSFDEFSSCKFSRQISFFLDDPKKLDIQVNNNFLLFNPDPTTYLVKSIINANE